MATTKGANWEVRVPVPLGIRSEHFVLTHTSLTLGATNDVFKICQIPAKGITVYGGFIQVSDMDTNATPTLSLTLRITDGTTTKVLIDQSLAGQAGGFTSPSKIPATENAVGFTTTNRNFWFELLIVTGAATAAAGTLNIGLSLNGYYAAGAVTE